MRPDGLCLGRNQWRCVLSKTCIILSPQALLSEKVSRLRAAAHGQEDGEAAAKAERRIAGLQRELAEAREDIERMTLERRGLAIKAKQLESKLERMEEERQGEKQGSVMPCDLLSP